MNGAGKSTLCLALAGFIPHHFHGKAQGELWVAGSNLAQANRPPVAGKVGIVLQNSFSQISGARATVAQEIAFGLENLGIERQEMHARVEAILDQLGIAHLADRSPLALSGGQQQQVAIASILVMQPQVLVLDEPTSQLDPSSGEKIFHILEQVSAQGITIVIAEHKVEWLARYADRVIALAQGKVIAQGTPRQVFAARTLPAGSIPTPRYTRLAQQAAAKGIWPQELDLPITLEEASQGLAPARLTPPAKDGAAAWPASPPHPAAEPGGAIEVENLTFVYPNGTRALEQVSVQVQSGERVAFLGHNGAGKTTLARHLNGLLRPAAGMVRIGGQPVGDRPIEQLAAQVGYAFQNPDDQIFGRTIAEDVRFGPTNLGFDKKRTDALVEFALEACGLRDSAGSNPYDLSWPMRRWVGFASILAMDTPILIFDEPTAGQDQNELARFAQLLQILQSQGKTTLVISHDLDFCAEHFQRLVVLSQGRILADGNTPEILRQTSLLSSAGLILPQLARLSLRLGLPYPARNEEEFLAMLAGSRRAPEEMPS